MEDLLMFRTLVTETSSDAQALKSNCAVCGEEDVRTHYGFFRRALKKQGRYECVRNNNCAVTKSERIICRACRLRKCLEVGMNPGAVRPDRDTTGRHTRMRAYTLPVNLRKIAVLNNAKKVTSHQSTIHSYQINREIWIKRLHVEIRTMLMTLLNIESMVVRGDTRMKAAELYPLRIQSIREIIEDPLKLKGQRSEIRYEAPYRMVRQEEFTSILYRRLIAAIDWVEGLSDLAGRLSAEDRIILAKNCFAPLMLFKCAARTAMVTERENVLCLCNFSFVPRNVTHVCRNNTYHLTNVLVDKLLSELVKPFRQFQLSEEEIVCMCATIVLNPVTKGLSSSGSQKVNQLRGRVLDTLFQVVKESRGHERCAARFGNLLLYLPVLAICSELCVENLRFAQAISPIGNIPLLSQVCGCWIPTEIEHHSSIQGKPRLCDTSIRECSQSSGCCTIEAIYHHHHKQVSHYGEACPPSLGSFI